MKTLHDYQNDLTVSDLHLILRIGIRQTYQLVKRPEFEDIRIGSSRYFSKTQLIKWLCGEDYRLD